MPEARKRPCTICRRWFRPDLRIGGRQRACGRPECQASRRQKTQASWRRRNPDYATAYRMQQRAAQTDPVAEPLRMPSPLDQLPWDLAKDQFGVQGADFIGVLGALLFRTAKDQFSAYIADSTRLSGTLPFRRKRPVPASAILNLEQAMRLEFHQLDRRWEHLRVREPHRQRRLMASVADSGQQTPIVVVLADNHSGRYVVIDGHKRIAALEQLGRDTVEATVWAMSEAEALLLDRSLRFSQQECALEQGWLLSEMEQRFGYSLEELARRFDRSVSWVSRRLGLVERLPEAIQQQVREGKIAAQVAMKYLVPVARISVDHCERMAAAFARHRCDTRQAGQLYAAWREGSRVVRERILAEPELFLKTRRQPPAQAATQAAGLQRDLEMADAILHRASRRVAEALPEMNGEQQQQAQRKIESARRELDRIAEGIGKGKGEEENAEPGAANHDSGVERQKCAGTRDRAGDEAVAPQRAQSTALELHRCAGDPSGGESRTVPATDPGAFDRLQGESGASP